jgi:formylglycine-generating enzyme required for sulfatase activity
MASASPRQEPFVYGSLGGRTVAVVEGTIPPLQVANAAVSEAGKIWESIRGTTDIAAIDEFIRQYGNTPIYPALAQKRRDELVQQTPARPQPQPQVAIADTPVRRDGVPLTEAQERGLQRGNTFRECEGCPEMVVVPAGNFMMGSATGEMERFDNEGPQRTVTISKAFAVGKFHVTRDQFAVFARETGFAAHSGCDWRSPGFTQDGSHPVCVSWDDANAYANWLAKKTGKPYRLLSEAEFEYAARAGTTTPFWWGSAIAPAQANYDGNHVYAGGGSIGVYRHGTVPAGSFEANPWGLYNVHGNAYQWTSDCRHDNYHGAPTDGSAWTTACSGSGRVIRGGCWYLYPRGLRAAARNWFIAAFYVIGFRLARTLI